MNGKYVIVTFNPGAGDTEDPRIAQRIRELLGEGNQVISISGACGENLNGRVNEAMGQYSNDVPDLRIYSGFSDGHNSALKELWEEIKKAQSEGRTYDVPSIYVNFDGSMEADTTYERYHTIAQAGIPSVFVTGHKRNPQAVQNSQYYEYNHIKQVLDYGGPLYFVSSSLYDANYQHNLQWVNAEVDNNFYGAISGTGNFNNPSVYECERWYVDTNGNYQAQAISTEEFTYLVQLDSYIAAGKMVRPDWYNKNGDIDLSALDAAIGLNPTFINDVLFDNQDTMSDEEFINASCDMFSSMISSLGVMGSVGSVGFGSTTQTPTAEPGIITGFLSTIKSTMDKLSVDVGNIRSIGINFSNMDNFLANEATTIGYDLTSHIFSEDELNTYLHDIVGVEPEKEETTPEANGGESNSGGGYTPSYGGGGTNPGSEEPVEDNPTEPTPEEPTKPIEDEPTEPIDEPVEEEPTEPAPEPTKDEPIKEEPEVEKEPQKNDKPSSGGHNNGSIAYNPSPSTPIIDEQVEQPTIEPITPEPIIEPTEVIDEPEFVIPEDTGSDIVGEAIAPKNPTVKHDMSTGAKILIGAGVTALVGTAGYMGYQQYKNKKEFNDDYYETEESEDE